LSPSATLTKPRDRSFRTSCGSDSALAHPQRLWSGLWNSSCRPYRFLSLGVVAARPYPRVKGPLIQIEANPVSLNRVAVHYSGGPTMRMEKGYGRAAGHVADGCSQEKDPGWMRVPQVVSRLQGRPKAAEGGGWYV
jgi:hypothetical protein